MKGKFMAVSIITRLWHLLPLLIGGCLAAGTDVARAQEDPPEIRIGERLFLETRFAQFFRAHATDPNQELANRDPTLDATAAPTGKLMGSFRGKSMNCRVCHLVDEHADLPRGGMRAYNDFAQRTPIPDRNDGKSVALRNSPALVASAATREFTFFHFDAEFATLEDLVISTYTGRNFGWVQGEERQAEAHIVHIIKGDTGTYPLSSEFGGSYRDVLKGAPNVPEKFRLMSPYTIDVDTATDADILKAIAKLVTHYVEDLSFIPDDETAPVESPYDVFLRKNALPAAPNQGESPIDYGRRLRRQLGMLAKPQLVTPQEATFQRHDQAFAFGEMELAGLRLFLAEPPSNGQPASMKETGNCIACHAPPHFSDFGFHNTGVAQEEYDAIHGDGAFAKIVVPDYGTRQKNHARYLPQKAQHPTSGESQFADIPSLDRPGYTDLGLWNVFLNPAIPRPQAELRKMLQQEHPGETDEQLLAHSLAAFKTSGLRDLGHSAPYFHTGRFSTLEQSVRHYITFSEMARHGSVRNPDSELGRIYLDRGDVAALAAFLRSLNEDYE
jgi:cytochrome c peroxidase